MEVVFSIIIPHKNTPDLLQYCLESIPVRDDVQVIVVDDNSDADKVDFDHFPQWKGANYMCCLTKEGKGAGYARNVGLEHATGKWVLFVDADDFLLPAANCVFDSYLNSEADVVFFKPQAVMADDLTTISHRADVYCRLIDGYYNDGDETRLRSRWFSPWSKIIRQSIVKDNNIWFDEIQYSNDAMFSATIQVKARRILACNESYYCITESKNSLTSDYLNKPGELQIRSETFFKVQMMLYKAGYSIDEDQAFDFLSRLCTTDRDAFVLNFKKMELFGYKRHSLINKLFKSNSFISRMKRKTYATWVTIVGGRDFELETSKETFD